ncbi:hypothetical protein HFP89_11425 [Wenzhouxiangella sp. XN79A]|uniref:hypothetical protein n=1 Tax=Wenzhouxiangella sp. XN79A TaxID=2724193 RepID=UPI00144A6BBF|nr:hypothetical protein [Wenzhouxiangella sp. XN79A]NKI35772.1 hypothetical protein [Wenzhouxiangella sp. XN79A]
MIVALRGDSGEAAWPPIRAAAHPPGFEPGTGSRDVLEPEAHDSTESFGRKADGCGPCRASTGAERSGFLKRGVASLRRDRPDRQWTIAGSARDDERAAGVRPARHRRARDWPEDGRKAG